MSELFYYNQTFNDDISNWSVFRVVDMNNMFAGTSNFNGDISAWDVSRVTNMNSMFYEALRISMLMFHAGMFQV